MTTEQLAKRLLERFNNDLPMQTDLITKELKRMNVPLNKHNEIINFAFKILLK